MRSVPSTPRSPFESAMKRAVPTSSSQDDMMEVLSDDNEVVGDDERHSDYDRRVTVATQISSTATCPRELDAGSTKMPAIAEVTAATLSTPAPSSEEHQEHRLSVEQSLPDAATRLLPFVLSPSSSPSHSPSRPSSSLPSKRSVVFMEKKDEMPVRKTNPIVSVKEDAIVPECPSKTINMQEYQEVTDKLSPPLTTATTSTKLNESQNQSQDINHQEAAISKTAPSLPSSSPVFKITDKLSPPQTTVTTSTKSTESQNHSQDINNQGAATSKTAPSLSSSSPVFKIPDSLVQCVTCLDYLPGNNYNGQDVLKQATQGHKTSPLSNSIAMKAFIQTMIIPGEEDVICRTFYNPHHLVPGSLQETTTDLESPVSPMSTDTDDDKEIVSAEATAANASPSTTFMLSKRKSERKRTARTIFTIQEANKKRRKNSKMFQTGTSCHVKGLQVIGNSDKESYEDNETPFISHAIVEVPDHIKPGDSMLVMWPHRATGDARFPTVHLITVPENMDGTSSVELNQKRRRRLLKVMAPGCFDSTKKRRLLRCGNLELTSCQINATIRDRQQRQRLLFQQQPLGFQSPQKAKWHNFEPKSSRVGARYQVPSIPKRCIFDKDNRTKDIMTEGKDKKDELVELSTSVPHDNNKSDLTERQVDNQGKTPEMDGFGVLYEPKQADAATQSGEDVDGFLNILASTSRVKLMEILHRNQYNVDRARTELAHSFADDPIFCEMTPLTSQETVIFNQVMLEFPKDFVRISRATGRSVSSCIIHYYSKFKHERELYRKLKREVALRKEADDYCMICDEGGKLIICDSCRKAFHLACLTPPLTAIDVPPGDWFCHDCTALNARHLAELAPPPPQPCQKTTNGPLAISSNINNKNKVRPVYAKRTSEKSTKFVWDSHVWDHSLTSENNQNLIQWVHDDCLYLFFNINEAISFSAVPADTDLKELKLLMEESQFHKWIPFQGVKFRKISNPSTKPLSDMTNPSAIDDFANLRENVVIVKIDELSGRRLMAFNSIKTAHEDWSRECLSSPTSQKSLSLEFFKQEHLNCGKKMNGLRWRVLRRREKMSNQHFLVKEEGAIVEIKQLISPRRSRSPTRAVPGLMATTQPQNRTLQCKVSTVSSILDYSVWEPHASDDEMVEVFHGDCTFFFLSIAQAVSFSEIPRDANLKKLKRDLEDSPFDTWLSIQGINIRKLSRASQSVSRAADGDKSEEDDIAAQAKIVKIDSITGRFLMGFDSVKAAYEDWFRERKSSPTLRKKSYSMEYFKHFYLKQEGKKVDGVTWRMLRRGEKFELTQHTRSE